MVVRKFFISKKDIPRMRIDAIRDIFEASLHTYKSDTVLERDEWLLSIFSFKIIVDIYADLDEFYSLQIEEYEVFFWREFLVIDSDFLGFDSKRTIQSECARDGMDLFMRKEWILDIQYTVFFDEYIQDISVFSYVLHIIIIMLSQSKLNDGLGWLIRSSEMSMDSFGILVAHSDDFLLIYRSAGSDKLSIIDIIVEYSYPENLFDDMEKSAFTSTIGSDKYIEIIIFLIIKFHTLGLGEVRLVRIT
jgi:hypothetical protein